MTGACRLLWPPLVVIDASCEAPWALSLVDGAKKCKSNAEYQACLNILLRCSFSSAKKMQTSAMKACFQIAECCFSSAKIRHFSAVCSFVEWLVKQNRAKRARDSAVSCWVCAEYVNLEFCVLYLLLYIVTFGNNTNVVKVVMVKVVKLDFWKYFSRLKIVYINNIYYLYILSLELSSLIRFRVWPLWPWPLWPLWPELP